MTLILCPPLQPLGIAHTGLPAGTDGGGVNGGQDEQRVFGGESGFRLWTAIVLF